MNLFKNKTLNQILISLLASLAVTLLIAAAGVLDRLDLWVQDAWFQQPKALDGEIIVIGIDEASLEQIGPYNTWDISVMASALEVLASDPANKPAVVAIDTLYAGESDAEADAELVEAADKLGNVVVASFANIGTRAVFEDGRAYYDYNAVLGYDEPFEEDNAEFISKEELQKLGINKIERFKEEYTGRNRYRITQRSIIFTKSIRSLIQMGIAKDKPIPNAIAIVKSL